MTTAHTERRATSFVIDSDTGSDDAVAILIAALTEGSSIRLITTVAGNVGLERATRNALYTLDVAGQAHVPVYRGAASPLLRSLETAQNIHGEDGLGDLGLNEPTASAAETPAVLALLEVARTEPGQHALVTIGPMTNIALAISIDPDFLSRFTHVYCMAGVSDFVGNVTALAEFNVWVDPEATRIVLNAARAEQVTLVGWDLSRKWGVMRDEDQAALRAVGTPVADFAQRICARLDEYSRTEGGLEGYDLPDPIAVALAIDPGMVLADERAHVSVSTDEATRGALIIDRRVQAEPANVRLITEIDERRFKEIMLAAYVSGPVSSAWTEWNTAASRS
ncbi:nucleoside hydrolase [Mycetocola tolaasinivorans]|uniref:Nucleoside hydrolase n=1 Tax=Mycetocola tolaasinivorans TaxID=76635 RepID=A0A3L7ACX1_9MICO|nr:nucleoside hydrolase [Mycetocola tolaasinivorans]RLP77578.1 nucleoside hydrolase [Mycetocola tolaasinivorans]